jgi:hypothetical protein
MLLSAIRQVPLRENTQTIPAQTQSGRSSHRCLQSYDAAWIIRQGESMVNIVLGPRFGPLDTGFRSRKSLTDMRFSTQRLIFCASCWVVGVACIVLGPTAVNESAG